MANSFHRTRKQLIVFTELERYTKLSIGKISLLQGNLFPTLHCHLLGSVACVCTSQPHGVFDFHICLHIHLCHTTKQQIIKFVIMYMYYRSLHFHTLGKLGCTQASSLCLQFYALMFDPIYTFGIANCHILSTHEQPNRSPDISTRNDPVYQRNITEYSCDATVSIIVSLPAIPACNFLYFLFSVTAGMQLVCYKSNLHFILQLPCIHVRLRPIHT